MLSGEDGFGLARRLRDDPATGEIPILMLTGMSALDTQIHARQAGIAGVVFKPFSVAELRQGVRGVLAHDREAPLMTRVRRITMRIYPLSS